MLLPFPHCLPRDVALALLRLAEEVAKLHEVEHLTVADFEVSAKAWAQLENSTWRSILHCDQCVELAMTIATLQYPETKGVKRS